MLPIMPFWSAKRTLGIGIIIQRWLNLRTLLHHLLDSTGWVDLHRVEIVEAIDLGRILGEFLTEGIGQVVRRIR